MEVLFSGTLCLTASFDVQKMDTLWRQSYTYRRHSMYTGRLERTIGSVESL